jgi:DNA-binding FrmR family transcriptional regulator
MALLGQSIEADKSCEQLVIQARAIEKAIASLITHMFEGFLLPQIRDSMQEEPDQAVQDIRRIFELTNK